MLAVWRINDNNNTAVLLIACYCVCLMLMSTLRVRFQGLGVDVDEKAKLGQERRKERKLRRRQRKLAQHHNFGHARAFLAWLRQRYVDVDVVDEDDDGGIFRNLSENETAAAAEKFTTIIALREGQLLMNSARDWNYFRGDDDKKIVRTLLENDCDSWKNDNTFILLLVAWAEAAKKAGHYMTLSYSSSSSEGGARVDMDALNIVRNLACYSDTFLASSKEVLEEVCSLVALGRIEEATTALTSDLLGDKFETVSPQDGGGIEVLRPAIAEAINSRSPTGTHRDLLQASAEWLVDATVTRENRRMVYHAVFRSEAVDHVSRASTSVGAAPAPST